MRAAVKVPSGFLVAAAAATATPDLSSLLLATSKRVTGTLGPTMIFFYSWGTPHVGLFTFAHSCP
jgi:hypothetical protein